MASISLNEEYLRMVGPLVGEKIKDLDDATWTAVIAFLFSDGFIKELDWSTQMGETFSNVLANHFAEQAEGDQD
jgi:hypothetical protein